MLICIGINLFEIGIVMGGGHSCDSHRDLFKFLLLPFLLDLIKFINRVRYLLPLPVLRYHVQEESPASLSWIVCIKI